MNIKSKIDDLLQYLIPKRNIFFLLMCLGVHAGFLVAFYLLDIIVLACVNAISVVIYLLFLFKARHNIRAEVIIVEAYFEIIIFSLISEIFTRGTYGFSYFVIGMVPVIFYLTPSYKNKRFCFQGFGVVLACIIKHINYIVPAGFGIETYQRAVQYARYFDFINLLITLVTILYTCVLYELELDTTRAELRYNISHDQLTGLLTRRYLKDKLEKEENSDITVVMIDIDDFKHINDRYGHNYGDEILKKLATYMIHTAKNNGGFSVRWGGEEFLLYFKSNQQNQIYEYLKEMCQKITKEIILPSQKGLTVTVGIASGQLDDFEKVVKQADDYLYEGKKNGKNTIVCG